MYSWRSVGRRHLRAKPCELVPPALVFHPRSRSDRLDRMRHSYGFALSVLGICFLATAGCGGPPTGMVFATPSSTVVSPDTATEATLIVWRSSSAFWKEPWFIVDAEGQFVANVEGSQFAAVRVSPGEHTYYVASRGRGAAFMADLLPGKIYVVMVNATPNPGAGYTTTVAAVRRQHPSTPNLMQRMLDEYKFVLPEGEAGSRWVRENRLLVVERMRTAREDWQAMSESQRIYRSLAPEDGFEYDDLQAELGVEGFDLSVN